MSGAVPANFKITICFSPAGFGLRKDASLLLRALSELGYSVELAEASLDANRGVFSRTFLAFFRKFNLLYVLRKCQNLAYKNPRRLFIHLENIAYPQLLRCGRHVLIPNQEWFRPASVSLLAYIDYVWCKTQLAQQVFSELGVKTQYSGFCTSLAEPLAAGEVPAEPGFFSRIGVSNLRGIEPLVHAWSQHPDWPLLNIVVHSSLRILPAPDNVRYVDEFPSTQAYHVFAKQFRFQVFATETEGFGHAIYEALELGAVVLVTDAPPMNEQLTSATSIKIESAYAGQKGLSPKFAVTQRGLECAVAQALALDERQILIYQQQGRQLLQKMRADFLANLQLLLADI